MTFLFNVSYHLSFIIYSCIFKFVYFKINLFTSLESMVVKYMTFYIALLPVINSKTLGYVQNSHRYHTHFVTHKNIYISVHSSAAATHCVTAPIQWYWCTLQQQLPTVWQLLFSALMHSLEGANHCVTASIQWDWDATLIWNDIKEIFNHIAFNCTWTWIGNFVLGCYGNRIKMLTIHTEKQRYYEQENCTRSHSANELTTWPSRLMLSIMKH